MVLQPGAKNIQAQTIASTQGVVIVDECGNEQKLNVRRSTACTFFMNTCFLGSRDVQIAIH